MTLGQKHRWSYILIVINNTVLAQQLAARITILYIHMIIFFTRVVPHIRLLYHTVQTLPIVTGFNSIRLHRLSGNRIILFRSIMTCPVRPYCMSKKSFTWPILYSKVTKENWSRVSGHTVLSSILLLFAVLAVSRAHTPPRQITADCFTQGSGSGLWFNGSGSEPSR